MWEYCFCSWLRNFLTFFLLELFAIRCLWKLSCFSMPSIFFILIFFLSSKSIVLILHSSFSFTCQFSKFYIISIVNKFPKSIYSWNEHYGFICHVAIFQMIQCLRSEKIDSLKCNSTSYPIKPINITFYMRRSERKKIPRKINNNKKIEIYFKITCKIKT